MPIRRPTRGELHELADELYLTLTDEEIAFVREMASDRIESYETIRSHSPEPRVGSPALRERSGGTRPSNDENPHNAWTARCEIRGDEGGSLDGLTVAVKDNISVAGVGMTCGSHVVEGYVSNVDATLVTRLLEAGADIVGKTNMDDMGMGTTGHSAFGPITNPRDGDFLAGGSSGGSAVVVANGEVDVAIGTDQGGSVRIPAAFCGVVGHKPTYDLVPYTGCVGLEHLIDHPGPMARDVETVARTLTTIAGSDRKDVRRPADVPVDEYQKALDGDVSDWTIALIEEGFDRSDADARVTERVREAIDLLEARGATIEEVSVPLHADAGAIHSICQSEAIAAAMGSEGVGRGWQGWYNTSWIESFGKFRRAQSDDFSIAIKLSLLMGMYAGRKYHSRYYASGMNIYLELIEIYDELLSEYDLLAMPTVVETAPKHDSTRTEFDRVRELDVPDNAAPFNRTGHPATSVPAGEVDGLPVGLQLVGPRFEDSIPLNAAYALEQARN
ncbi:MAG: amidase [Euryarchaeota archaeon]|nr:amidase [Euryarchaeota archaeon]